MDVSDAQRLKQLEDENRRLKHMVADQALDIQALKAVLGKKWCPDGILGRRGARSRCCSTDPCRPPLATLASPFRQ
jgi:hypothetical protein